MQQMQYPILKKPSVLYVDNFYIPSHKLIEKQCYVSPKVMQKKIERYLFEENARDIFALFFNEKLRNTKYESLTHIPKISSGFTKPMLIEFLQKNTFYNNYTIDWVKWINMREMAPVVDKFGKFFPYYINKIIAENAEKID